MSIKTRLPEPTTLNDLEDTKRYLRELYRALSITLEGSSTAADVSAAIVELSADEFVTSAELDGMGFLVSNDISEYMTSQETSAFVSSFLQPFVVSTLDELTDVSVPSPSSGQVLGFSSSEWKPVDMQGRYLGKRVYTTTGSAVWTKSTELTAFPGARLMRVTLRGGGGGGGGADSGSAGVEVAGGGGGEGGFSMEELLVASMSATENYCVGGGGTAGNTSGTDGGVGQDSTFGTTPYLTGSGGSGGAGTGSAYTPTAFGGKKGGDGGAASGGDINIPGGDGGAGTGDGAAGEVKGGKGGGHGGGQGAVWEQGSLTQASRSGALNSGGGGGGGATSSTGGEAGAKGATGSVILEYFS